MQIKVHLFGLLIDLVGKSELIVEYNPGHENLITVLKEKIPALNSFPFILSVNREAAFDGQKIESGDEIMLLPPFSGG